MLKAKRREAKITILIYKKTLASHDEAASQYKTALQDLAAKQNWLAYKMRCDSLKRDDEASLQYEAAVLEVDVSPDAAVSQDEDVSVLRVCLPPKMRLL